MTKHTPDDLAIAIEKGDLVAIRDMIDTTPKLLEKRGKAGPSQYRTPLLLALAHRQYESATLLVELGANVNAKEVGPEGNTPLILLIAFNGPFELMELLLAKGADPNLPARNGDLPLPRSYIKAKNGLGEKDREKFELLVEQGADLDASEKRAVSTKQRFQNDISRSEDIPAWLQELLRPMIS